MIINESLDNVINRDEIIICDWDNVIQFIDKAWIIGMKNKMDIFEPYFDLSIVNTKPTDFITSILAREEYYIDRWLLRKGITRESVPDHINNEFLNIYLEDPIFYEKCTFLIMAQSLKEMVAQKFCNKVIFLSHTISNNKDWRKEIIFDRHFGKNKKFELNMLPLDVPKHEWINKNCIDYTTFIDDRFDIIQDVILHTDSSKKTFIMPFLGYNEKHLEKKDFFILCENKGIVFSHYKQQFLLNWS